MRCKNISMFVLYLVVFVGGTKCIVLYLSGEYKELLFWSMGGAWIIWLVCSFKFHKDLPGVGPFDYRDGKNQEGRIIYTTTVVLAFLFVAIFG